MDTLTKMTRERSAVYDSYPFIAPEQFAGKLKDRVALVTGTSVGIGRTVAKAFAAAGASVACVARREADLTTLVEEIKTAGGKAIAVPADVTAPGAAKAIVAKVEKELGPTDILINNAGITRASPVAAEPEDLDIWWRVYEVNVRAPVSLTRAVLPGMIERGGGMVLSTSSQGATLPLPVMTAYVSSKAAISKFHENLTYELEGTGVLSYAVHPGTVPTELGKPVDVINTSAMQHPAMQALLGWVQENQKFQTPECCADLMVAIAADPRWKVLNGHHLNADQDMEPVLKEAEKAEKGRIGRERLYLVNIGEL